MGGAALLGAESQPGSLNRQTLLVHHLARRRPGSDQLPGDLLARLEGHLAIGRFVAGGRDLDRVDLTIHMLEGRTTRVVHLVLTAHRRTHILQVLTQAHLGFGHRFAIRIGDLQGCVEPRLQEKVNPLDARTGQSDDRPMQGQGVALGIQSDPDGAG